MERKEQFAAIIALFDHLEKKGSWCGETHIQKAVFFLKELKGNGLGFDFVMYKHGPFSFDLRDMLTAMRVFGLLELKTKIKGYAPCFIITQTGERFASTIHLDSSLLEQIEEASKIVGDKGIADLEKLSTALYIAKKYKDKKTRSKCAEEINELKPHISVKEAKRALEEAERL